MRTVLPKLLNPEHPISKWIEEYISFSTPRWSGNTLRAADTELRRFGLFVGARELSPMIVHGYQSNQYARKCTPSALFRSIEWTQRFLEWCECVGYLEMRRFSKILKKPHKPLPPVTIFTHAQYEQLKELARGTNWYYAIVMSYRTGTRYSDTVLMKWKNVNLEQCCIRYTPFKSRLTGRTATCPFEIDGDLHRLLADMHAFRPNTGCKWDEYICPDLAMHYPHDGVQGAQRDVRTQFTALVKKIGATGLTFHDLRHSFISRLIRSGASYPIGSQITGLASPQVFCRYAAPDVSSLRVAIENMSNQDEPPEEGDIIKLPGAA